MELPKLFQFGSLCTEPIHLVFTLLVKKIFYTFRKQKCKNTWVGRLAKVRPLMKSIEISGNISIDLPGVWISSLTLL